MLFPLHTVQHDIIVLAASELSRFQLIQKMGKELKFSGAKTSVWQNLVK